MEIDLRPARDNLAVRQQEFLLLKRKRNLALAYLAAVCPLPDTVSFPSLYGTQELINEASNRQAETFFVVSPNALDTLYLAVMREFEYTHMRPYSSEPRYDMVHGHLLSCPIIVPRQTDLAIPEDGLWVVTTAGDVASSRIQSSK